MKKKRHIEAKKEVYIVVHNPEHVVHQIRSKSSTDSGVCRPLFEQ